jgi:hypothetical protein
VYRARVRCARIMKGCTKNGCCVDFQVAWMQFGDLYREKLMLFILEVVWIQSWGEVELRLK